MAHPRKWVNPLQPIWERETERESKTISLLFCLFLLFSYCCGIRLLFITASKHPKLVHYSSCLQMDRLFSNFILVTIWIKAILLYVQSLLRYCQKIVTIIYFENFLFEYLHTSKQMCNNIVTVWNIFMENIHRQINFVYKWITYPHIINIILTILLTACTYVHYIGRVIVIWLLLLIDMINSFFSITVI